VVVNQAPDHFGGVKLGETEGKNRVDSVLTFFGAVVVEEPALRFKGGARFAVPFFLSTSKIVA
jgi:hypothetical protein